MILMVGELVIRERPFWSSSGRKCLMMSLENPGEAIDKRMETNPQCTGSYLSLEGCWNAT